MDKKVATRYIPIGLMLFALFFGAGNLIFPASMGQNAGVNVWYALIGFCITGVGGRARSSALWAVFHDCGVLGDWSLLCYSAYWNGRFRDRRQSLLG